MIIIYAFNLYNVFYDQGWSKSVVSWESIKRKASRYNDLELFALFYFYPSALSNPRTTTDAALLRLSFALSPPVHVPVFDLYNFLLDHNVQK